MLIGNPTKNGTGITIMGDTFDLRELYETIHFLEDNPYFNGKQGEFILDFAYEVRKARDNYRDNFTLSIDGENTLTYQGFNLTWTKILFTVSQLRHSASYKPVSLSHQSILYRLESIIEKSLVKYDKKAGLEVYQHFKAIPTISSDFDINFISSTCFNYTYQMGSGKKRFRLLPAILDTMNSFSQEYRDYCVSDIEAETSNPLSEIATLACNEIKW